MTVDRGPGTGWDAPRVRRPPDLVWPTVGPGRNPGGLWVVAWLGGDSWSVGPLSAGGPVEAIAAAHADACATATRVYDGDTGALVGQLWVVDP